MKKALTILVVVAAVIGIGIYLYLDYKKDLENRHPKFYSGNGRLEATEFYVSGKLAGRIEKLYVREGDLVRKGDKLVQMQTNTLEAQRASSIAKIKVQESNLEMAKATVLLKENALSGAQKAYDRQKKMLPSQVTSRKTYDEVETQYKVAVAELKYAQANVGAAAGRIAQEKAELQRIEAEIKDSLLVAAYDGRVEYVLAHEGEVISAGGRILNMVDLTDAYMTFFLPTRIAGLVQMGAEVKLIFDADPDHAFFATITFIDPIAQFTPKSVETKVEREKLMFRVKAHIDPAKLKKYIKDVKTGLPGVAWVKLDPQADWNNTPVVLPAFLKESLPQEKTSAPKAEKKSVAPIKK